PQRSTKNTKSFNKFFFCDFLRSFVVNNYVLWAKPTLELSEYFINVTELAEVTKIMLIMLILSKNRKLKTETFFR
ncbi:MAG: hypothetical protein WCO98_09790, partial [bacterium]